MATTRNPLLLVAVAALVAGCSSAAQEEPSEDPTSTPKQSPKAQQTINTDGEPAPDALADFDCAPNDDGDWQVSGTLRNTASARADYRVTVFIGPPDVRSGTGREITVADIAAGGSRTFRTKRLPAAVGGDSEELCSVRVAKLS